MVGKPDKIYLWVTLAHGPRWDTSDLYNVKHTSDSVLWFFCGWIFIGRPFGPPCGPETTEEGLVQGWLWPWWLESSPFGILLLWTVYSSMPWSIGAGCLGPSEKPPSSMRLQSVRSARDRWVLQKHLHWERQRGLQWGHFHFCSERP